MPPPSTGIGLGLRTALPKAFTHTKSGAIQLRSIAAPADLTPPWRLAAPGAKAGRAPSHVNGTSHLAADTDNLRTPPRTSPWTATRSVTESKVIDDIHTACELTRTTLALIEARLTALDGSHERFHTERANWSICCERLAYWDAEVQALQSKQRMLHRHHSNDILLGSRILLDRAAILAATLEASAATWDTSIIGGLRTRLVYPGPTVMSPYAVAALINHEVGYGTALTLRDHQIAARDLIRGALVQRATWLTQPNENTEALLRHSIVMPVGGGKTRTMIAAFAEALAQGAWNPTRNDKCIILNHTTRIHLQNLKVTELLAPYFKHVTKRALRVSSYKADNKDCSGDIVVVSVPTVNDEASRHALVRELSAQLGSQGNIIITGIDEVHHWNRRSTSLGAQSINHT